MRKNYALPHLYFERVFKTKRDHWLRFLRFISLVFLVSLCLQNKSFAQSDCTHCGPGCNYDYELNAQSSTYPSINHENTDVGCQNFLITTYVNDSINFSVIQCFGSNGVTHHNIFIYFNDGSTTPVQPPIYNQPDSIPINFVSSTPGEYIIRYYEPGDSPLVSFTDINGVFVLIPQIQQITISAHPICSNFSDTAYIFQVTTVPSIDSILVPTSLYYDAGSACEQTPENVITMDFSNSTVPVYNYFNEVQPDKLNGNTFSTATDVTDYYINTTGVGITSLADYLPGGDSAGINPIISVTFSDGVTTMTASATLYIVSSTNPASPLSLDDLDINTICAPGVKAGLTAKLTTSVSGGFPPYTYNWAPVTELNQVTLNNYTSSSPTLNGFTNGGDEATQPVVDYVLTITDASASCPSTAAQIDTQNVYFTTITDPSQYDLASRDSHYDLYSEPNLQTYLNAGQGNVWLSPDIWNRYLEDGLTTEQDPQYNAGAPNNYMYTLIRNVGCATSPLVVYKPDIGGYGAPDVNLYWTMGGMSETWPDDWTTTQFTGGNEPVPQGEQIVSLPISPQIGAGKTALYHYKWEPPNPENYWGTSTMEVCFLSRILDYHDLTDDPTAGMSIPEGAPISPNVINNNNVVTRNSTVTYVGGRPSVHHVLVGNAEPSTRTFSLTMVNDYMYHAGAVSNLYKYVDVVVSLDSTLWSRWKGNGYPGTYSSIDTMLKTVTFDGTHLMALDSITMYAGEEFPVQLSFNMLDGASGKSMQPETVHFRQEHHRYAEDKIYGGYTFFVQYDSARNKHDNKRMIHTGGGASQAVGAIKVFPNPATSTVNFTFPLAAKTQIRLMDMSGRAMAQQTVYKTTTANFNVGNYAPGIYLYQVITDGQKQYGKIVVGR